MTRYDELRKLQVVTSYFNELSQMSVPGFSATTMASGMGQKSL